MLDRATKLRWRRLYRRRKRQMEDISLSAGENLEEHFIHRLTRLVEVRRFVLGWVLLLLLVIGGVAYQARALGQYYQTIVPRPGGVYTEGIVGQFSDANPIFATGSVDSAVAHLVFAGLFKYDQNDKLVGDLAQKLDVDDQALTYTVHLKPNLTWHDDTPLTARDVVFTYQTIQNPDTRSPMQASWQGIKMTAPDDRTVVFSLPNPFSAFPETLTNGIVPEHLLSDIPVTRLRSIAFNTVSPVGAGPFKWEAVEVNGFNPATRQQRIALVPFEKYNGGEPKLNKFIIRAFADDKQLAAGLSKQELTAAAGLSNVPDNLQKDVSIRSYSIPLTGAVMAFFKLSDPTLQDVQVRKALVMATNRTDIIQHLGYPVIPVEEPLLKSELGYSKDLVQLKFDKAAAAATLDQDGWKLGDKGLRYKAGKPLRFSLFSQSNSEYTYVTQALQKQWREVGVDAQVILQSDSDLQTAISAHNYDALVYGIAMGNDPDVFAFWHSSQADKSVTRLNLSEFKSAVADQALEAGRTRSDPALRAAKYRSFLQAWRDNAPAVALYQPRFLYVTHGNVYGFDPKFINTSTDRYANVANWEIRQTRTSKP